MKPRGSSSERQINLNVTYLIWFFILSLALSFALALFGLPETWRTVVSLIVAAGILRIKQELRARGVGRKNRENVR